MYHLVKKSRMYGGNPYTGPANDGLPAMAETLQLAQQLQEKLNARNPVGFDIYDADTGKRVDFSRDYNAAVTFRVVSETGKTLYQSGTEALAISAFVKKAKAGINCRLVSTKTETIVSVTETEERKSQ